MKQFTLLAAIGAALFVTSAQAQNLNGFAVVALHPSGDPFSGFVGPMRATQTGIDYNFAVVCSSLQNDPATGTRRKVQGTMIASIPDGTSIANSNTLIANTAIAFCAEGSVSVSAVNVVLPVFQRGA